MKPLFHLLAALALLLQPAAAQSTDADALAFLIDGAEYFTAVNIKGSGINDR